MGALATIAEAASMYRLPRSTLYRWIKDGRLTRTPRGRVSLLAVERLAAGRILDPAARFTGAD